MKPISPNSTRRLITHTEVTPLGNVECYLENIPPYTFERFQKAETGSSDYCVAYLLCTMRMKTDSLNVVVYNHKRIVGENTFSLGDGACM